MPSAEDAQSYRGAAEQRGGPMGASKNLESHVEGSPVWQSIRAEAEKQIVSEPGLAHLLRSTILDHRAFESALANLLAVKLATPVVAETPIQEFMEEALIADPALGKDALADLMAFRERDPVAKNCLIPFLYFKGFHALQVYRVANFHWKRGRQLLAMLLQNQASVVFGVDIHPASRIGTGIMIDHATGLVVGETAVIEDNVSIMQSVTLGGTGKEKGDRHPKVRSGALISVGAKILGNIEIGANAKVGAGSVVLENVLPHTTVAGVPAKVVGRPKSDVPALDMHHELSSDVDKQ